MKHRHIHLKLDPKRDVKTFSLKHYNIHVLKGVGHSSYVGIRLPLAMCGVYGASRLVGPQQRERVTCPWCLRLMIERFPKAVNPRSGMAMPRPGKNALNEDASED
jgi:hypothetical protein